MDRSPGRAQRETIRPGRCADGDGASERDVPTPERPGPLRFIESLYCPKGPRRAAVVALITAAVAGCGLLVYATGGVKFVWPHSMYLPVLFAGAAFGVRGGLVTAVAGGLVLGPLMPIDVTTGESQATVNWLYRTLFFSLAGVTIGFMADRLFRQLAYIRYVAFCDRNTGAANRAALTTDLDELLHTSSLAAVVVANVDNFAEVTETFGIESGDRVMAHMVSRLRHEFEREAQIYQIETDKLALVFSPPSDRLLRRLSDALGRPFEVEGVPIYVDVTFGRADFPEHGSDPPQLVQRALLAMRAARRAAIQSQTYRQTIDTARHGNLAMLAKLSNAIAEHQLELHYQPKLAIGSGRVTGVEALLRWHHPELGLVPPGRFIPQAEQTHLIHPLTGWVLEQALMQIAQWSRLGIELSVAVNVSMRNLLEPGLVRGLAGLLERTGADPHRLEIEVTESAIMAEPIASIERLEVLRAHGVPIAVDDFGTGQTSLSYLKILPVDVIKIDRSFTAGITGDTKDRQIVEAVVSLSRRLGLVVVAEGVENAETLDLLHTMDCDMAQGFFIATPMSADQLTGWLAPIAP